MARPKARGKVGIEASGERVALRPFRPDDVAKVEPWYGEAAPTAVGDRLAITLCTVPAGRQGQDEPLGVIDCRAGYPAPGWLAIDFVAVAEALRARGYGSEAVRLLEAAAQRQGLAHRFLGLVSLNNGLGLYFWLRLGYRPAHPGELDWPGQPPQDIIAMVRVAND